MVDSNAENEEPGQTGQLAPQREHPKRFYASVTTGQSGQAWHILLDGRSVRTPGKHLISLPSAALANIIAQEWDAQHEVIDPATMPATRIVNTAIDGVVHKADSVRDEIAKFAGGDLLCYRAGHPRELVELQRAAWDEPLAWLAQDHSVNLQTATGIMPINQPALELQKFRNLLDACGGLRLAALHVVVTLTGSAVLGIGILESKLSSADAWSAAHVDEDWQITQWGEDHEAKERRAFRWREFSTATEIIRLLNET